MIASGPAKQPVVGLTDKPAHNLYPVPLPSVEADVMAKVELVNRADVAARAYDPRIQRSAGELCGRAAANPGHRLRRQFCRRFTAPGAHERVLHGEVGQRVVARDIGRRRSGGPGLFPDGEDARALCQGSGAAGDYSTRRDRGPGGRDGSRARSGMAGNSVA